MQKLRQYLSCWLVTPSDNGLIQLLRYGFVSVFVFIIDFVLLFAITQYLGVHYLISAAIGFLVGMFLKHWFCVKWVFKRRSFQSKQLELLVFIAIGLGCLVVSELALWLLTDMLGIYYLYSKVIATAALVVFKFSLRKKYLFS